MRDASEIRILKLIMTAQKWTERLEEGHIWPKKYLAQSYRQGRCRLSVEYGRGISSPLVTQGDHFWPKMLSSIWMGPILHYWVKSESKSLEFNTKVNESSIMLQLRVKISIILCTILMTSTTMKYLAHFWRQTGWYFIR